MKTVIQNNKGQSVMEYIILTSLIGILCLTTIKNYGGVLNDKLDRIQNNLKKSIKTR